MPAVRRTDKKPQAKRRPFQTAPTAADIMALHARCGVYTQPKLVRSVLDSCGWRSRNVLAAARLLEPSAGDGNFLVEAVDRLMKSIDRHGGSTTNRALKPRILSFELSDAEACKARKRVFEVLRRHGLQSRTATALTRAWIQTSDFLLTETPRKRFTHIVGNPPYVRWTNVPVRLQNAYRAALPASVTKGDLLLPFLDRAIDALEPGGQLGFVCSSRWRHSAYAAEFRNSLKTRVSRSRSIAVSADTAFSRSVDAYADIALFSKATAAREVSPVPDSRRQVRGQKRTLRELGCTIRVGPALGNQPAFVGTAEELDVEDALLARYVGPQEIAEGKITWAKRYVLAMHDAEGRLRNLRAYPRLEEHLEEYRSELQQRMIVLSGGAPWYRTIDRVRPDDWVAPKILLPEIAKVPRVALDSRGLVPSHGIYAIFAPKEKTEDVYERLLNGGLGRALCHVAPRIKGGYFRCYRRILDQLVV